MPGASIRLRRGAARAALLTVCLAVSSCASAHQVRFAPLGAGFSHRVPFEIGYTDAQAGNAITIEEVWGTRPAIEVGGSYIVKGTYKLAAADEGVLTFWESIRRAMTAKGWNNSGPNLDTQVMRVRQGEGEFVLLHAMSGPGYFHVVLQVGEGRDRTTVSDVYFGHGESLLKNSADDIGDILVLAHNPGNGDTVRIENSLDGFNELNNPSLTNTRSPGEEIARLREQSARLLERIRTLEERLRTLEKSSQKR